MRSYNMMGVLAAAAMLGVGMSIEPARNSLPGDDFAPPAPRDRKPNRRKVRAPVIVEPAREPIPDTMTRQRRRAEERAAFKRLPRR